MTSWRIIEGDCVEAMRAMDEASVDAVVCDPPYLLSFMGKDWDRPQMLGQSGAIRPGRDESGVTKRGYDHAIAPRAMQEWHEAWALEALRVLKPGGHLLAFGGTRTHHRLTCAIEDAGFEIRDCLAWLYGSGFPKSLDVSKAIDKAAGAEREAGLPGRYATRRPREAVEAVSAYRDGVGDAGSALITAPATPDAERWQGWGTALKPAHEPIVLARKPLAGTVAANVLAHGTGALNVDATRIGWGAEGDKSADRKAKGYSDAAKKALGGVVASESSTGFAGEVVGADSTSGRWPANVILDPEAAALLDEQTGESASRIGKPRGAASGDGWGMTATGAEYDDTGGASRFFYCPKADTTERNTGLHGQRNSHPTVKPVALMRWLCRLVTPPGGTILDPFTGSGTTGIAALREGFAFIGIERETEYVAIARARIIGDAPLINGATELAA